MKSNEILQTLAEHRVELRRLGVRRLGLFGSTARGEAGKSSDLDFLVDFKEKSFDAYMDLKAYLERIFHRPVDLVLVGAIKPGIRAAIRRDTIYAQGL